MSVPDDFDTLFGLGSPPTPPAPTLPPQPGGAVESRKEVRVRVKWAARVLQPDGRVVPLRTRDISETGIGLVSETAIASHTVLKVALAVPHLEIPGRFTTVTGSFKTAHVTVSGPDLVYGGTWIEIEPAGRELIRKWVRRLHP